jgi:hypothetical protein
MNLKLGLSQSGKDRLKVPENKVLRRIFGRKREEVRGVWREMDNKELHNLLFLPNIIRFIL